MARQPQQTAWRRVLQVVVLVAIVLGLLALVEHLYVPGTESRRAVLGVVTRVYDGDTFQMEGTGKVRLIGVDALDSYNLDKVQGQAYELGMKEETVRRWAEAATRRARQLLEEQKVRLERAPEPEDRYGRTLAYVYVQRGDEEVFFNKLLLEEGLAVTYRRFDHPRRELFLAAERRARQKRVGLWKEAEAARVP